MTESDAGLDFAMGSNGAETPTPEAGAPIPTLTPEGHLPPGRFRCTLEDVRDRFVLDARFSESSTRRRLFDGLIRYLSTWEEIDRRSEAEESIIVAIWIAGSFASAKLDPEDVDITPIVNGLVADRFAGKHGSKKIKDLIAPHRQSVKAKFGVEVFPLAWYPVISPFHVTRKGGVNQQAYVADRGRYDDWWQRCRYQEEDIPSVQSCPARRGYLEVTS